MGACVWNIQRVVGALMTLCYCSNVRHGRPLACKGFTVQRHYQSESDKKCNLPLHLSKHAAILKSTGLVKFLKEQGTIIALNVAEPFTVGLSPLGNTFEGLPHAGMWSAPLDWIRR